MDESTQMINVDQVFLDHENPRHEPYEDPSDVIDYLCKEEQVLQIAEDIAKLGLNPLELFALIPGSASPKSKNDTYIAAEGNRRLCAIMLLNDPDLAPADKRKAFEAAAINWEPISKIFAVVFEDRDSVKPWLNRIHGGQAGGIGRRSWNSEQKSRHSGYTKNTLAQNVLDYAEKKGMITKEKRKRRLSTVQRFLSNPLMRDAMGIDASSVEDIKIIRPRSEFDLILEKFMSDTANLKITTRAKLKETTNYSHELRNLDGVTGAPAEPQLLESEETAQSADKTQKRKKRPKKIRHIPYDEDIHNALESLQNYKLEHLYYSICDIDLTKHTPLVSVGVWAFFETLTACAGKPETTDFHSYLSAQRLNNFGLGDNKKTKSIRQAVKRISEHGNTTKHDQTSAAFNGDQLANDMQTLAPTLLKLIEMAKNPTP